MEDAAKKFVRRVLLIHLLLLLGVVGVVYFASREVYDQTREQATEQARSRQTLLASQTARGIEAFYRSIFNDLDLLRQADKDEDAADVEIEPATKPVVPPPAVGIDWRQILRLDERPNPGNAAFQNFFAGILWKQLQGRSSVLFGVNRDRLNKKDWEKGLDRGPTMQVFGSDDPRVTPKDIVLKSVNWLKGVDKPQISPFLQFSVQEGESVGMNLVCVPVSARNPRLLVAAVPIQLAQGRFTNRLNNDGDATNAFLCDESGTIMISSNPELIGRPVDSFKDPQLRDLAKAHLGSRKGEVVDIQRPYVLGGHTFPPGIMAVEPVSIAGKRWAFMVTTPMAEVDAVVNRLFKRAIFWAIFVVSSMTAILFSTAFQLIRARARMERVRADLLTKELTQAREIQLAWLPRQGVSVPTLDIAAINQPASHISGDFYNWFELPDGRTVVTIGDVTGHGLSAAFLMATTQLLVHTTMLRLQDPGKALTEVNRQLCTQVFNGQFVTMLVMVIDVEGQTLEVATAGHYPPVMGTPNGEFDSLPIEAQLVLGIDKTERYPTERFVLPEAASFVLYTDGVLDAEDAAGKRFKFQRIVASAKGHGESAQSILDSIVGHVDQFRGSKALPDDLTLVCVQTQAQGAAASREALSV